MAGEEREPSGGAPREGASFAEPIVVDYRAMFEKAKAIDDPGRLPEIRETVKTGPETGADSPEIRDSDVPLIEESDSVAVGTMLPEAPEEEPASPPEDVQAGVLEEGDVVEIGEML